MGRPRDTFWKYAHPESNNGRFKCNFCDTDFTGGISRIKSHLSGIKGRDIDICLKVPDHIRAEARQAIDSLPCKKKSKKTIESPPCKKKGKRIISISDDDDDETVFVGTTAEQHAIGSSPSNNKGGKSVVVEAPNDDEIVADEDEPNSARLLLTASCTSRERRKKDLDKQFLKCYEIMDGVSKEASQLLVQLVKGVSDFGPNYELPNLATPDEQILEYERGVKASWRETGFTLMFAHVYDDYGSEEWNVNVFAYCPKGMLLLTSGNFSAACTAVAEFGERHCLQAIALDDGRRISLQTIMMKANYLGVFLTSASPTKVIHKLVCRLILFHCHGFLKLLDAVEIIFTYMWKFSLVWRRKIFNEWKKHTRLKCTYLECCSDRLMLLRPVIEHEAEVISTVQSMDISKWVSDVVTTIKFWTIGKELICIIDILFPLARLVQGTVPAFGYFYEAVNKASDALDECYHKDPTTYSKLKSWGWDETLRGLIKPIHAAACLLNPAIMCGENFKEESQMMEGINELKENFFVDQADRDLFLSQVELNRAKSPSIFTATAYRKSKTLHPWAWWREFGGRVPELQKCAIQILSQPCDAPLWIQDLPVAKNASERRKLKLSLMEKFSGSEASSLEPIDLETAVESFEYEEQEYFDDLSTSSNPAATLGLKTRFLDPEEIDFSEYQRVHDFFFATTEISSTQ